MHCCHLRNNVQLAGDLAAQKTGLVQISEPSSTALHQYHNLAGRENQQMEPVELMYI